MPNKEINLLPQELKDQKKGEEYKKFFGNLSLVILGVAGVFSLVSSSLLVQIKVSQNSLKKETAREEEKIKDLSLFEDQAVRLEAKIAALNKITEKQSRYSVLLAALSKSSPADISVTSLSTFGDGRVSVSGFSQSYGVLSNFISGLLDPGLGGKVFNGADLTSASLDEVTGKIRFALVLLVRTGGLK